MELHQIIKSLRKRKGLTGLKAAIELNISETHLYRLESGESIPTPDMVVQLSRLHGARWLKRMYCGTICEIGRTRAYPVLNKTDSSPTGIMVKLLEELRETEEVVPKIMSIALNKRSRNDFSHHQWTQLEIGLYELHDVKHAIDELIDSLADTLGMNIEAQMQAHTEKCRRNGYLDDGSPEPVAMVAESRAVYTAS